VRRLLVATSNPGKLREFARALSGAGIEVVGLDVLADPSEVPETGASFEENARIKAEAYSRRTELPVLADDSGIEVEALGGAPGVASARFGGEGLTDEKRYRILLEKLRGVPEEKRRARFRSVLVLARRGRAVASFEGVVEGTIADRPRGSGGFGYDPVFLHEASGKTFGEMTAEEKQAVSHRGRAIRAFLEALESGRIRLD
jgi:XTP/dITP diphosphohydrolase